MVSNEAGRLIKMFLEGVAPSCLNMGPFGLMAVPFMSNLGSKKGYFFDPETTKT